MARYQGTDQTYGMGDQRIMPLSRLDDYEVAGDSQDVRGWPAVTLEGRAVGDVDDLIVDLNTMKARYLVVDMHEDATAMSARPATDRPILVPTERARIDEGAHRVQIDAPISALAALPTYDASAFRDEDGSEFGRTAGDPTRSREVERLTRSAEELRIGRRTVPAGEVEIRKHVETEHVTEPVTRTREDVRVERRPIEGGGRPGDIREDQVRIPLTEEEVVVEKRPVAKEEVIVTKVRHTETENVEADLRKEKVDVERETTERAKRRK